MKMSDSMHNLNDYIEHYKRHIGKATETNDNEKIMKCILKLSRLPITVQNLQKTGIGRVVNNLRKYDGQIGESAKLLVVQWKNVVKIEESENFYQKEENSDEEHDDASSANDNDELQINQSITSSVASTSYYNNNSNEPGLNDENNGHSSDPGSCKTYNHYQNNYDKISKYKKSKKDKDSKKRKESSCNSTDEQGDEKVSKKLKKDNKYESIKIKKESDKESEKSKVATTSHRENGKNNEDNIKKEKKSSHSDKKKDKHKSTHKSESKSDVKSESRSESKSESRSESKSESRSELKSESRSESKSHRDKHESKTGHREKNDSKKKIKEKSKENSKQESKPSTSSCKTFEEALLGIEINKKKKDKSKCRDLSSRSNSSERESSPIPTSMQLAPINLDPEELIANYKPLPQLDIKKKKSLEEIDALATSMKTKNMRTKVYSGNKSTIYTEVPSLADCCIKTLKENIDDMGETGGVPYMILEPVLSHTTPDQLYQIENHNGYLIEDTGPLWEYHSKKEFRNKVPEKNETWRNFYIRCLEEREIKLHKLRQNINANQAASTPVRKTQLAYVDSAAKPPRGVARRQAKYHTPSDTKRNILNKSMMGGNSTAEALSANNRSTVMATGIPVALNSNHSTSSSAALKKKKAPLMQKALQLIKSTRRR